MILPLPVGNALRVFLEPPSGALKWRVLRKAADTFVDENDPDAFLAYEGDHKSFVDFEYLQNGSVYLYRAFYWNGSAWSTHASSATAGTPNATYEDRSTDALVVVRDRINAGLQVEVSRGVVKPKTGFVQVLTAPPVFEDARWPLVTVQLLNEGPGEDGLGYFLNSDGLSADDFDPFDGDGWMARVQLAITAWSLNPDERIALRQSLRRLVAANIHVFDNAGIQQVNFSQQDTDAVSGEYPAPVYQSIGTFTCLAPVSVGGNVPAIREVISRSIINGD